MRIIKDDASLYNCTETFSLMNLDESVHENVKIPSTILNL